MGLFQPSREAISFSFWPLVLTALVFAAFSLVIATVVGLLGFKLNTPGYNLATNIGSLFVSGASASAFGLIILNAIRGKKSSMSEALEYAKQNYVRFFLANLIYAVAVGLGIIALIVPGIILAVRLSMVNYILIDNPNMSAMEGVKASWEMMRGHSGKYWGIIGVSFLMLLPTLTIIGVIATVVLLVMYAAAVPLLYEYIKKNQVTTAA